MKGEDAIVQALGRSADRFYAIPGYPVTGIGRGVSAEPVINEKVALEYALGDSLAGRRAAVIMKNAGLNACADPLVQAGTQGLGSGVVVVAGDDLVPLGSTSLQDSRYYGELARVPVIEPGPATCFAGVEEAFRASERFSRVAILRLTPELLFCEVCPDRSERRDLPGTPANPALTMKGRVQREERLFNGLFSWSRENPLNSISGGRVGAGAAPGESAAVTVYPPPGGVEELPAVNELGRPFLREHRCVEPGDLHRDAPETFTSRGFYRTFCRGCPFLGLFLAMKEQGVRAAVDAGCSILLASPLYGVGVASYGLGSAVAVGARSTGVAVIGDYALLHSGIQALIDVYEKKTPLLCIVLRNRCLGMTGGQEEAYDPRDYLGFAKPVVVPAGDTKRLSGLFSRPVPGPRTIIVEGECPKGGEHETIPC
ncbi:thiamine pyrophosphate-dependent enzyme [Methanolinea mesophila]|uniref:thiamine pyrophosphate-dependent enzyme n=1 Tax=Methanolinea mesophila TaxID=547055 RepID=UPI001AE49B53|nr:thiamine pyrophosphate-dependent enzyme [Methanolinea mesophila]